MNTKKRWHVKILPAHPAKHAELIDFGDRSMSGELPLFLCVSGFTRLPSSAANPTLPALRRQ
jgi:hypothetical protein